jgi:hypothetical protein
MDVQWQMQNRSGGRLSATQLSSFLNILMSVGLVNCSLDGWFGQIISVGVLALLGWSV